MPYLFGNVNHLKYHSTGKEAEETPESVFIIFCISFRKWKLHLYMKANYIAESNAIPRCHFTFMS